MKKFILWFAAILLIILVAFIYWKYIFTFSEGNRSGLLQKFSYKGVIFKTYEGELIMSSIRTEKNVALASEKFHFSVRDVALAKQMMKLEGTMVVLHYREKNGALPWRGETAYLVDSVTPAGQ